MTDYVPIDCGLHSEYELAIMHRNKLQLTWRDDRGTVHLEVLTPIDLRTRHGEEFMRVRDREGVEQEIRLDYILRHNPA
jgi:Rho-binding antiterminator